MADELSAVSDQLSDIVMISKNAGQRVSPQGIASVIRHMIGCSYIGRVEEVRQEGWTMFYAQPGPNAHSLFAEGEAPEVDAVFKEVAIGYGAKAQVLDYDAKVEVYVFVEFRGVVYGTVHGSFTEKLHGILYIKPAVITRPHVILEAHVEADGTEPVARHQRRDPNRGRTGVAVEDL